MSTDKFEEALQALQEQESVPQSHVELYREVFEAQTSAKRRIASELRREIPRGIEKRWEQGLPVLSTDVVEIRAKDLEQLFDEICSALKKRVGEKASDIEILQGAHKEGKLRLDQLVKSVAFGEGRYVREISAGLVLRVDLLIFLGMSLARPIFELWAEKVKGRTKDESWLRPYCPICGSEPYMARLHKEDGRRILGCPLCGSEWSYMRMECPFCQNNDQNTLRFFFVDDESPYRVDVCEKCKRYLKTVDERKMKDGEPFLLIEDIATTYLDVLAEKEGYVRAEQVALA